MVLTNPPFGTKGSVTYAQEHRGPRNDDTLTIVRSDFWVQTANKQLNFLQHIFALLKPGGRAAVVVPDNVLFETGAATAVRRRLLYLCRVHALLRLPSGLFYAQGVKSNVIFFDKPRISGVNCPAERIWVYELRSDKRFSLKTKPLQREDLQEFVTLFRAGFQLDTNVIGAQAAARLRKLWHGPNPVDLGLPFGLAVGLPFRTTACAGPCATGGNFTSRCRGSPESPFSDL